MFLQVQCVNDRSRVYCMSRVSLKCRSITITVIYFDEYYFLLFRYINNLKI